MHGVSAAWHIQLFTCHVIFVFDLCMCCMQVEESLATDAGKSMMGLSVGTINVSQISNVSAGKSCATLHYTTLDYIILHTDVPHDQSVQSITFYAAITCCDSHASLIVLGYCRSSFSSPAHMELVDYLQVINAEQSS